jgi:uncharacterized protein YdaU (DUF1376 family)
MHYYQKNIGDYRRDTMHLSPLEHGVYNLLIDTYYLTEKPLCTDHADLMRTHCLRSADEVSALENVLKDFFDLTDLGYMHKRCDVEIEAFHTKSKSASESAKARWERVRCERIANAIQPQCEGNANHKPLTINQERINHKPKTIKSKTIAPMALLAALGIVDPIASDWIALRKSKKAAITETALNGIQREADKAGVSLRDALRICCERGWIGFQAKWLNDSAGKHGGRDLEAEKRAFVEGEKIIEGESHHVG